MTRAPPSDKAEATAIAANVVLSPMRCLSSVPASRRNSASVAPTSSGPAAALPKANPPERDPAPADPGWGDKIKGFLFGTARRQGALEAFAKSAVRNAGSRVSNQILRGVLGGVSGRRR